jgi:hypothetical protein
MSTFNAYRFLIVIIVLGVDMKKVETKAKRHLNFKLVALLLVIFSIITLFLLIKSNLFSILTIILMVLFTGIIDFLFVKGLTSKLKVWCKNVLSFFVLILIIIQILFYIFGNKAIIFLSSIIDNGIRTYTYDVYVLDKSDYKELKDINNKMISYIMDDNINEVKDKINYLYKKVNLSVLTQNNKDKNNANQVRKKNNKRISFLNDNSFFVSENNQNKNNLKILLTVNNFYQKNMNQNNIKRTMSNNKNKYYMKKSNTSSSPFKNIPNSNMEQLNSSNNKSKIINRIKNINAKIYEGSEEGFTTNSNSIDTKKNSANTNQLLNNNKNKRNINITKPYIKKIIQNYDKAPMDENKKNVNINISNHKILFEGLNKNKDGNKDGNKKIIKKLLISKYLNNSNILRGRSLVNRARDQNNGNMMDKSYNYDSSPVFERNNSNYRAYHFNKRNIPFNDMSNISITQNNSNSNFQEIENKSLNNYYNKNKSPFQNYKSYKINSKYILYNSSLTSRNSFQFNKNNNNKLTDSFMNMQLNYLKNDINQIDKNNISTSNEYNNNNKIKDYSLSNALQDYQNYNQNNNSMYETNYFENFKNKKFIKFKKQNDMIDDNINNNDKNKKIKYI